MITIYHNPRCSKSRASVALLEHQKSPLKIIKYLEEPPTINELKNILNKLEQPIDNMIRQGEDGFSDSCLSDKTASDEEKLAFLSKQPRFLQRPIVVSESGAVIGRPPENALALL